MEDIYTIIVPMKRFHPEVKDTIYCMRAKVGQSMHMRTDEIYARIVSALNGGKEFVEEFDEYMIHSIHTHILCLLKLEP